MQNKSEMSPQNVEYAGSKAPEPYLKLVCTDASNTKSQAEGRFKAFKDIIEGFVLKTGHVREDYKRFISFGDALRLGNELITMHVEDVRGFAELGLSCSVKGSQLCIEGVPTVSFKGVVRIEPVFLIKGEDGWETSKERTIKEIPFSIEDAPKIPDAGQGADATVNSWKLWQKKDHPADAPYQTDDETCDSAVLNLATPITILAASRRGRSHEHCGSFRDDAFAFNATKGSGNKGLKDDYGWHVFVVSDGAGSAKYSRKGAEIVCKTMTQKLCEFLNANTPQGRQINEVVDSLISRSSVQDGTGWLISDPMRSPAELVETQLDKVMHAAVYEAYAAVSREAKNPADPAALPDPNDPKAKMPEVRDYSATALCLAMKRFTKKDGKNGSNGHNPIWVVLAYWVGDGAFAIWQPNWMRKTHPTLIPLGSPDGGEYAGETRFITMSREIDADAIRNRTKLLFLHEFAAIFMATDGVADPFFDVDKNLQDPERWKEFFAHEFQDVDDDYPESAIEAKPAFSGVLLKTGDPAPDPESAKKRSENLLEGLHFKKKGYHDDRTALMIINDKYFTRKKKGN